jgi:hypothetical protein
MRILRLAAIILVTIMVLLAAAAVGVYVNRASLVRAVLVAVRSRTGLEIAYSGSHLRLSSHLEITLENPRVISGSSELVNLERVRAAISYHALIFSYGMPLYALTLDTPDITVPMSTAQLGALPLPQPGAQAVQGVLIALRDLGTVAWRIQITNGTIRDSSGVPVVDRVGMIAYRKHWDSAVWHVSFDARVVREPMAGLRIAGALQGGIGRETPPHQVASGKLRFWHARLGPLTSRAALRAEGQSAGKLNFTLGDDGKAQGTGEASVRGLTLSGRDLKGPDPLGGYSVRCNYAVSSQTAALSKVSVRYQEREILTADGQISEPFGGNPSATVRIGAVAVDTALVRAQLKRIVEVPRSVNDALALVSAGKLSLESAEFTSTVAGFRSNPLDAIRDGLRFQATLSNAAFTLPASLRLPPVSALGVTLQYAGGVITARQGSARLGGSRLSDITTRLEVAGGLRRIPYRIAFKADADVAELYAAGKLAMKTLKIEARKRLTSVAGRIGITLSAQGILTPDNPAPPPIYQVRIEPNRLVLKLKGTPAPVEFRRGAIAVAAGELTIDHVALAISGGDGTVNGVFGFDRNGVKVRNATIDLHQMQAGPWLALLVDPTDLQIVGPIGGKLTLRADPARHADPLASGRFVLNKGEVNFGFMRSPMLVQGATFSFDKHTMKVAMPATTLEGQPLTFAMSIADLEHPVLRIDADAQELDFEVLKFIRMPWSPSTPPSHFPIPVRGFVKVSKAHLGAFPMRNVRGDFNYDHGAWRVWNFEANSFRGKIDLEIIGRKRDDWIQIKGKVADIDAAPLFLLSGKRKESPVLGKMWVAVDLRADTNSDFFQTLSGTISLTMRDGVVNRFSLISRMLALIDLKSWLTARFPDPRVSGLPYDTIFADLKGAKGVFQTEQFVLEGPVMAITATGSINFADSTMDMNFALFPFSTVNWLLSKIPLIGSNVAGGTGELVAAYMHVYGPVDNPSIMPMPIRSVAEFVIKTLGMPINIIRPNTIK